MSHFTLPIMFSSLVSLDRGQNVLSMVLLICCSPLHGIPSCVQNSKLITCLECDTNTFWAGWVIIFTTLPMGRSDGLPTFLLRFSEAGSAKVCCKSSSICVHSSWCVFSFLREPHMLLRIHHKSTFIWTDDRKYILHIVFDTGKLCWVCLQRCSQWFVK